MCRRRTVSHFAVALLAVVAFAAAGCGRGPAARRGTTPPAPQGRPVTTNLLPPIELPQASQRLGTAVVILIDTSGSMIQTVRDQAGRQRPKFEIANDALRSIIKITESWKSKHPETPLYLGISSFSSSAADVLKIGPFDSKSASDAVRAIRRPAGGTAIGSALVAGFRSLYSTGCVRKHVVCITDGDNTVGTPPDLIARQLYAQTHGDVQLHFVAFDTSPRHFGFLNETGGSVFEAADAEQLQARLTEIYEKRILAEAMPAEKE